MVNDCDNKKDDDTIDKLFRVTKTISGRPSQIIATANKMRWSEVGEAEKAIDIGDNVEIDYRNTIFYDIEKALQK